MAQKLKFGNGTFATKEGSTLAYNDENNNYKPLPFTTTRNSIGTRVNKEGLIEVVGRDVPRIDYTDSADGVLLLENAATNLATYSQDYTHSSWNKVNSSGSTLPNVTPNYGISPDGTQNADRIQVSRASGVGDFSSIYKSITVSSSNRGLSVWLKSLSGTPTILITNNNGVYVSQQITTEWVRYVLDLGVGTLTELQLSVVGSNFVQGVSESADFLAWGYQLETGVASSYIPTNGSTVTRQADTASGAGNSEVFNDSQGVLFADISSQNDSSTKLISLASTSGSENTVWIGYANGVYGIIRSNGVTTVETNIVPTQSNEITKCAILYSNSNVKFYVNGFNLFEDTNISMPIGLDQLRFSRKGGSLPFYGKTKELGYYDEILTDLELETLTSYRTLNELVTELNLNTL